MNYVWREKIDGETHNGKHGYTKKDDTQTLNKQVMNIPQSEREVRIVGWGIKFRIWIEWCFSAVVIIITCVLLTSDDYVYTQREETETQR